MIKIGIIGGAGYVAGELLRILIHHPQAQIIFVQSNSQEGKPISEIHKDLVGDIDLSFTNNLKDHSDIDVLFLCGGHGQSAKFLQNHDVPDDVKIIDLSRDFRLKPDNNGYVYGLPELNYNEISESHKVANPGCFATCIQLGLLPLAMHQAIQEDVHVHAITGSTGAGALPAGTTHFSWRNNNVSIYKAFRHQHLDEILQSVQQLQAEKEVTINFLPVRGNFTRGIFASIYMKTDLEIDKICEMYETFYKDHPFTVLTQRPVDLKQVVNTNKCIIGVEKIDGKVLITSVIDNLLKGAAGQAVQNMNLIFGLLETSGLLLKPMAF